MVKQVAFAEHARVAFVDKTFGHLVVQTGYDFSHIRIVGKVIDAFCIGFNVIKLEFRSFAH